MNIEFLQKQNAELVLALREVTQSLDYVNDHFPQVSGIAKRVADLDRAHALLEAIEPTARAMTAEDHRDFINAAMGHPVHAETPPRQPAANAGLRIDMEAVADVQRKLDGMTVYGNQAAPLEPSRTAAIAMESGIYGHVGLPMLHRFALALLAAEPARPAAADAGNQPVEQSPYEAITLANLRAGKLSAARVYVGYCEVSEELKAANGAIKRYQAENEKLRQAAVGAVGLDEKDRLNIKLAMTHLKESKFHTAAENMATILEKLAAQKGGAA